MKTSLNQELNGYINTPSFAKVPRKDNVSIPANTGITIWATVRQTPDSYLAVVEDCNEGQLPAGIMIYPTLSTVKNGLVPVQVRNYSSKLVKLPVCQRLALVSPCEENYVEDVTGLDGDHCKEGLVQESSIDEKNISDKDYWIQDLNIGDIQMNDKQQKDFREMLFRHKKVFSQDDDDLGFTDVVTHKIKTTDSEPVCLPDRRIPPQIQPEVKRHLQKWLKAGVIKESDSPYASQIVIVKKKDSSIRICLDYRALNKKTVRDAFPLPRIEETIEAIRGAKYFSSLDLTQGYLQLAVDEQDQDKTAFRALGSLYQFTRMPFGLCNGPASFCRLMTKCFGDLNHQTLILYLDDILVFSCTIEEMIDRLDCVFERLEKFGLKLKPRKCSLFKRETIYLGHVVSADGISTDPEKIRAIEDWEEPKTEGELRSYLGLCSYYRRFIKNFAHIAKPLNSLLSGGKATKDSKKSKNLFAQNWNEDCSNAFKELKKKLITAPVLGYPDFSLPFIVETDASFHGLGAVLSQDQAHGKVVIAYASRALRPNERNMKNYSSMKLELLAMKWAITEKFRDYLYGSKFTVFVDNNPLSHVQTSKKAVSEINWLAQLADFDFDIKYKSGKSNRNADALSRKFKSMTEEHVSYILEGCSESSKIPMELFVQPLSKNVSTEEVKLTVWAEQQEMCTTLPGYSKQDLLQFQKNDSNIARVLKYVREGCKPSQTVKRNEPLHVRKILAKWDQLKLEDDILYRVIQSNHEEVKQFVLPTSLKKQVLMSLHNTAGHQGIERTTALIKNRCYWPMMNKDIMEWCKQCERCLVANEPVPRLRTKMCHLVASEPLDLLHSVGEVNQWS
jgi:hypothetical protein